MPENSSSRDKSADKKIVDDILRESESVDIGIVQFERQMQLVQVRLRKIFCGTQRIPTEARQSVIDNLNHDWQHYYDTALVSGRLFLIDGDAVDLLPSDLLNKLGEAQTDKAGRTYYFAEDVELMSSGVEISCADNKEGPIYEVDVAHGFMLPDDEVDVPIFYAKLGELSKHEYALPTTEEVMVRLEKQWPKQADLIYGLFESSLLPNFINRLNLFTKQHQKMLIESPKFRSYVELAINERMDFSMVAPYIMHIKGAIECLDGQDPNDQNDYDEWLELSLSDEIMTMAYHPKLKFVEVSDAVKAYIVADTVSEEDGDDDTELIRVDVRNLLILKSTRAIRALTSIALDKSLEQEDLDDLSLTEEVDSLNKIEHRVGSVITPENKVNYPERISKLIEIEDALQEIVQLVKVHQKICYPDVQQATEASNALINDVINRILENTNIYDGYQYECSGSGIYVPNYDPDINDIRKNTNILVYGLNREQSLASFNDQDTVTGSINSVVPYAQEVADVDSGEVVGYAVYPVFFVTKNIQKHSFGSMNGASFSHMVLEEMAIVPANGLADIKVVELEKYRKEVQSFDHLKDFYGPRSEFVKTANKIKSAFWGEYKDRVVRLNHIELLNNLEGQLETDVSNGRPINPALDALESLFVSRYIHVRGYLYKIKEGLMVHDESCNIPDDELLAGEVIDIKYDSRSGKLELVINSIADEIFYAPTDLITDFRF